MPTSRPPGTIRILVGNSASVSREAPVSRAIWDALVVTGDRYGADLVASTETGDFRIANDCPDWGRPLQGPAGWESKLAALVRASTPHRVPDKMLLPGTPGASSRKGSTGRRGVLRVTVGGIPVRLCHAPYQPVTMRARYLTTVVRRLIGVKIGDFNIRHAAMVALLAEHQVHSDRLMHVAVPRWRYTSRLVDVIDRADLHPRADHEALVVDVTPRRVPLPRRPRRSKPPRNRKPRRRPIRRPRR